MTYIEHAFALLGAIWAAKSFRELWRTRKDNRHDIDTRGTGAF